MWLDFAIGMEQNLMLLDVSPWIWRITDESSVSGWLLLIDIDMDMKNPTFICFGNLTYLLNITMFNR